ncbi:MAG: alpha-amylase [Prevotella sp.]|nr:alpha-amylase [Prevotella sp.]
MASSKLIVYQIFTRLYSNRCQTRKPFGTIADNGCGKMNDYTPSLLKQIRGMGVTHVWYTGVIRHATTTDYTPYGIPRQHAAVVKGRAGSPYAIVDYYDVDPDLAVDVDKRLEEFDRLVNRTHRAGMKVVIDFVPNHVARQYHSIMKPRGVADLGEHDDTSHGFDPQNNFYYCPGQPFAPYFDLYHGEKDPYAEEPAKATGNDCFHNAPQQNDWYETVKLNYGVDYYAGRVGHFDPVPDTWHKMLDILLYWAGKGVDGFRCDMAEMVPAEFWAWATSQVKHQHPDIIFIGEVYNPGDYRRYVASGFDLLYDKVGMYDALIDVVCHRRDTQAISWAWQQTDDIRQHMLYFLENHDEQRLASDFVAGNAERALPALVVGALLQSSPFMVYGGQEWGERGMDAEGFSGRDGRSTIFDYWSMAAERENSISDYYRRLLSIARTSKAVCQGEMFDLMYVNQQYYRQYAFMRKSKNELLIVVANFDDIPVEMNLKVPSHAFDFLKLKEGTFNGTNLLTDSKMEIDLQRDREIPLSLAARQSLVLQIKL